MKAIILRHLCAGFALMASFYLLLPGLAFASAIITQIPTPDRYPYRIFDGTEDDSYWIVTISGGLMLLERDASGYWTTTEYPIGYVSDAAGPDSRGWLHCSCYIPETGAMYLIFDCTQKVVHQSILLGSDYQLSGVCLSPDETSAFVLGMDWPRIGEIGGSYIESGAHPDSGILWRIDLNTLTVADQGITAALPSTIYYAETTSGPGKILVSTKAVVGYGGGMLLFTDIILPVLGLPRESQLAGPFCLTDYRLDFVDWSEDNNLVAICGCDHPWLEEDRYQSAIWLFDPDTSEVVDYIMVTTPAGGDLDVAHACISQSQPGTVYISTGNSSPWDLCVINKETGTLVEWLPTPEDFHAEFIHETPDGLLIVTGGESGMILIVDPDA